MKNSLLIHYFLVNLGFSCEISVCPKNFPCKAFYSGKNGVWNRSQTMWDSFQTSTIIVENLSFLYFWNPSCVHRNVPAYACFDLRMQVATHIRRPIATLVILFSKNDFCLFKRLYFLFQHPLNQFNIWLCSKLALGLRVRASSGYRGPSYKGYKIRYL